MIRSERSDAELILASGKDPAAFRELYDRWAERLLAYFFAACVMRRSRLICWRRRSLSPSSGAGAFGISADRAALGCTGSQPTSSLTTSATRRCRCEQPADSAWSAPKLDAESAARIEALCDEDDMRASLTAAIGHMSDVERDAVELRVIAELDYHQIAARLNCSEAAARTRVHRGLARLRS